MRVLLLSADVVGPSMAGAGIRAWELARALAAAADVTIGAPAGSSAPREGPRLIGFDAHDPASIRPQLEACDAVIAPPLWPRVARAARASGARTIFDLYVPEPLETLEHMRDRGSALRALMCALSVDRLDEALHTGHHFACASEKQRDLWLGAMLASRLVSPALYDRDETLRSVIDVVPFGVPAEPPRVVGPGPRERFPELPRDAELILWNGGIWSWLDAPTAIRAVAALAERRPRAHLVFMGGASDHPPARRARAEAEAAARDLGVLGGRVLFNEEWVPYAERAAWLLQADCALSTHADHLETRFAFRTRLLDCFWAGLPVVCTAGDDLGDRVERDGLGRTAPAGDAAALAAALERVLDAGRGVYAEPLAQAASDHAWAQVAEPLLRWVSDPEPPRRLSRAGYGPAPGQRVRTGAYRAARRALDTVGLRGWPRL